MEQHCMNQSRRDFAKLAAGLLTTFATAQAANDHNVRVGVCTYSFRDLPRDNGDAIRPVLQALGQTHATVCELFSPQLEPEDVALFKLLHEATSAGSKQMSMEELRAKYMAYMHSPEAKQTRENLRNWRLTTPMSHFAQVRQQFAGAGVEIFAYTLNFSKDFTDEELDKCFGQAKALRAKTIAASTQLSMLPRLKPLAEKHKVSVSVHGHSETDHPDEFSSPETFQKALDMSPYFKINLDIGHFSAAGFDPVEFIQSHHEHITHLHLKDRKKNNGPNEPFGGGDTPIKEVLQLLKKTGYPIPALIEYEYPGKADPVQEVNNCLAYCRSALAS
jgi:sugar phosphate isomerase/epimerase